MDVALMPAEEVEALLEKTQGMTVEQKMKLYLRLREGKGKITKHLEAVESQFKQVMEHLENLMLADADANKVTGFTIANVGTSYTSTVDKFSIANDATFFDFMLQEKDIGFLERRVSSTYIKEYMENHEGMLPPGINKFSERTMRVRKAGAK